MTETPSTWNHEKPFGDGESIQDSNKNTWVCCPHCNSDKAYLMNTSPYTDERATFECPDCETTEWV